MIDDRQQEFATLYSLDLLEGQEKARFEQELAQNPELRRFVADLKETAAHLADAAPVPELPPGLKDRILRDAPHRAEVIKFPRNTWVPWSVAAAVALMAALVGQTFYKAKVENEQLRARTAELAAAQTQALARVKQLEGDAIAMLRALSEKEAKEKEMQLALAQSDDDRARLQRDVFALRERDLLSRLKIDALVDLTKGTPDALIVAAWDADRKEGVLTGYKLPPKQADQDYQLWIIDPAYAAPVSGGLVKVDETGAVRTAFKADKPITSLQKLALSIEPAGGSESARGPVVMLSK